MLFLDRFDGQSIGIVTADGKKLRVEVIGVCDDGSIRLGFDGDKKDFVIDKMTRDQQAHFNLRKKPSHQTGKFPSDSVNGNYGEE